MFGVLQYMRDMEIQVYIMYVEMIVIQVGTKVSLIYIVPLLHRYIRRIMSSNHLLQIVKQNIQYKSVNLSDNNTNYQFSAISCVPNQKDENNVYGISIFYSSFSNNTVKTYYWCIYFYYDTSNSNEDANNENQYEINVVKHNIYT